MQRYKSIDSVTSATSSQRGREKRTLPTHMIIQREIDNEIMLLPVSNIVNSSVIGIKTNRTATFKIDINDRKQHRGRIIQLGTEEECAEQYQVFDMTADVDQENIVDEVHQTKRISDSTKRKANFEKQRVPSIDRCESITMSSNSNVSSICKKQATGTIRKRYDVETNLLLIDEEDIDEDETFNMGSVDFSNEKRLSTKSSNDLSEDMSTKYKSKTKGSRGEQCNKPTRMCFDSQMAVNSQPRNISNLQESARVLDISGSEQEQQSPNVNSTNILIRFDELSKRCNALTKEIAQLRLECDRLTKENEIIRRTTIPMPDATGRQWFINVAKMFFNKTPDADIATHARALNIDEPRDLVACIQDTTSNTARQVVRLLYSSRQLLTMTGPDIPKEKRAAIRAFAESQKGPISNHKFNEAINGVFRSRKCEVKTRKRNADQPLAITCHSNVDMTNDAPDKSQRALKQIMDQRERSTSNGLSHAEENQHVEDALNANES